MKIPEPIFPTINAIVKMLLRSPLHGLMSKSVLVMAYTGRKSGRALSTPLRYRQVGDNIQCLSSTDTMWWRNLKGGAPVQLLLRGEAKNFHAEVLDERDRDLKGVLLEFLQEYPQDAAYHEIKLNKDKTPNAEDLEVALGKLVAVEARPLAV